MEEQISLYEGQLKTFLLTFGEETYENYRSLQAAGLFPVFSFPTFFAFLQMRRLQDRPAVLPGDARFPEDWTELYRHVYSAVLYLSNHTHDHYRQKSIPKKSGGTRTLLIPDEFIRTWQEKIAELILPQFPISPNAYAYRKGLSIKDNAKKHLGAKVVVKIDLKDFFNHVTFHMVRRVFSTIPHTDKHFPVLLANLCCVDGCLPQGAETSPMLSNICFCSCDREIEAYCLKNGITYSRYCDDLTFSGDFDPYPLISRIYRILSCNGFEPNNDKTSVRRAGQRLNVTGITVNEKLRVSKDYRKEIRQEIYYIRRFGVREHLLRAGKPEFVRDGRCSILKYLQNLLGRIQYVLFIDGDDGEMTEYRDYVRTCIKDQRALNERKCSADSHGIMRMHLNAEPFSQILMGQKTVEIRLNDEKRRALQKGDVIRFVHAEYPHASFKARVTAICRADSFADLFSMISLSDCGFGSVTPTEAVEAMRKYYSLGDEAKFGVIAIRIKVIE